MTKIHYERDADPDSLSGRHVAVVGYGNQGRSWALNMRDSGVDVAVHVRADASRTRAADDGFEPRDIDSADTADVMCLLVPDDTIPVLPLTPRPEALVVVASGYTLAFGRFDPACDVGMVAPRMVGPDVRDSFEEGAGFVSAIGVHRDRTGSAWDVTKAIALAIGGLRQGAIELTPLQEAILDLATEQLLAPALRHVNVAYTQVLAEAGVPMEAILCELYLSGEVERTFRRVREDGYVAQFTNHSPTSQYGQLSRMGAFEDFDVAGRMRELLDDIRTGRFADEWDSERDTGHGRLEELRNLYAGPELATWEAELRRRLGAGVISRGRAGRAPRRDP